MSDMIWLGGAASTLFLAVLSIAARRWWPLPYVWAVLLGFGTGVLLWSWPDGARGFWWMPHVNLASFAFVLACVLLVAGSVPECWVRASEWWGYCEEFREVERRTGQTCRPEPACDAAAPRGQKHSRRRRRTLRWG